MDLPEKEGGGVAGVTDRRRLELGLALAVKVRMGLRFGDRDGTDREWSWE